MRSIGFRCWSDRFAFVVLEGTQEHPSVIAKEVRHSPKNVSRADFLAWVRRNVQEILTVYEPDAARYKATEPSSQMRDLRRAEVEGVVQEAACSHRPGCVIESRIKLQIRKDVRAFEGPARYVKKALGDAALTDLASANFEEAGLVALCGLPES
jgi:hypothetical protein